MELTKKGQVPGHLQVQARCDECGSEAVASAFERVYGATLETGHVRCTFLCPLCHTHSMTGIWSKSIQARPLEPLTLEHALEQVEHILFRGESGAEESELLELVAAHKAHLEQVKAAGWR